jgi:hypothetical protein
LSPSFESAQSMSTPSSEPPGASRSGLRSWPGPIATTPSLVYWVSWLFTLLAPTVSTSAVRPEGVMKGLVVERPVLPAVFTTSTPPSDRVVSLSGSSVVPPSVSGLWLMFTTLSEIAWRWVIRSSSAISTEATSSAACATAHLQPGAMPRNEGSPSPTAGYGL